MHLKFKKTLAFILCLAMMIPAGAVSVFSDDSATAEESSTDEASSDEEASDDEEEKDEKPPRTEEEAMAEMTEVDSNDKMTLYANKSECTLALLDKNSGEIWWSNPVDASTSAAKPAQKKELLSGMKLTYAEVSKRSTSTVNSKTKGKGTMKISGKSVMIEYTYREQGITIPVTITLEDDYLKYYLDTTQIIEVNATDAKYATDTLVTDVAFMTTFGAGRMDEDGYFVIPDGSGAIIDFNNGKTVSKTYTGKVYGRDITAIKTTKPSVTRTVSLPMYGIVKGNSGMMVVADKGDTCASINTYVSRQTNTDYNSTYFDFELRTSDDYFMGGDSSPLKVFEKRGILVPEVELRYYPVSAADGSEIDYTDIAESYRNYLINDKAVEDKSLTDSTSLYIDLYGGTLQKKSIVGIPVTIKAPVTTFNEAQNMLTELNSLGVDNMVVTYNNYANSNIAEKITTSFSPASSLGGKGDMNDLMAYASANNITLVPSVDNQQFKTGNGYWTMTNTAIRVSNAYSRILIYDLAHSTENQYYDAMSLFTPASYSSAFTKLIESYQKNSVTSIAFGSMANTIYGDYGKKATSREMAKGIVQDIYSNAKTSLGTVLSNDANAYVLPYTDYISNIPVCSSKFDIFDRDIPFYQMVMHGVTPYSTTTVNGDADAKELVLQAIAAGSSLSFDFVGIEASELKDTKLDKYFYAYYPNWTSDAAGYYNLTKDILNPVSDAYITGYSVSEDLNEITTVYSTGYTTVVNMEKETITADGKEYKLENYVGEEAVGE